jgi:protein gp37
MALKSKIEWTENTWNPITGCTQISEGCENCYALRMASRLQKMGNAKYENGFRLTLHEDCLNEPYTWKKPSHIFVNSMSDLFHAEVPIDYIKKIFTVMNDNPQHIFQVLTKRADRLADVVSHVEWTDNIWLGVTVESEKHNGRVDALRFTPAKIKFVSFEPLLNDVGTVDLSQIDWAIVGGESGWHARPMKESWVLNIKKQCEQQSVLFYFKQWGGVRKKQTGRTLLGQTWDAIPAV